MDVDARIEALEAENDRLRDQLERLETDMGLRLVTPLEWRLTGAEMRMFGVLLAREMVTKEGFMAVLYRDLAKDEAEIKIVDVFICKMRKKLKPFEISIETIWGQGYRMSAAAKARAGELMAVPA